MDWLLAVLVGGLVILVYSLRGSSNKPLPTNSLRGKTVIITGANTGIGKKVAENFAMREARVILACRSKERGEKAALEIREETKNKLVEFMPLDLCSWDSIHNFATKFKEEVGVCHILVLNAGVLYLNSWVSDDVLETKEGRAIQWQSNFLGHFQLAVELYSVLCKSDARVISVTSSAHRLAGLNWQDLESRNAPHFIAYSRSKLAQIYFTYSLQRRFEAIGSKATAFAVHPGYIPTDIARSLPKWLFYLWHLVWVRLFNWDLDSGAAGPIYVASSPEIAKEKGGQYFSQCTASSSSKGSYDTPAGERLWDLSERMVGIQLNKDGSLHMLKE